MGFLQVMIYDNAREACVAELGQTSDVLSVQLRADKIMVVTVDRVRIYSMPSFAQEHEIFTCFNPLGVGSMSSEHHFVLACPSSDSVLTPFLSPFDPIAIIKTFFHLLYVCYAVLDGAIPPANDPTRRGAHAHSPKPARSLHSAFRHDPGVDGSEACR